MFGISKFQVAYNNMKKKKNNKGKYWCYNDNIVHYSPPFFKLNIFLNKLVEKAIK